MQLLLLNLLLLLHTFYALEVNQNYPDIAKGGSDGGNLGNFEVGPSEEMKDVSTRATMVRQWRESLRSWERSLRKARGAKTSNKDERNLKAPQRGTRLQGKRVKAANADVKKATKKKKKEKLKPQERTFFQSSEPEQHYDHYDIFGYPGDHYYPHFMDYDDLHDYDYDKDDVDHGNFFADQFHDLLDFFF